MNKLLVILLMLFVSSQSSGQMEEIGYNTTDVGAEFQWYKGGKFIGLHVAVNAKLHHSIHGEIGYYFAREPTAAI
jgi:hypothetical protein